jgi:hypothetical protein
MALNFSSFGKFIASLFDTPAAGAASLQTDNTHTVVGGGFNLGNAGGWSVSQQEFLTSNYNRRGITQSRPSVQNKHAIGDAAGNYIYVNTDGGIAAQSDEGATAITGQVVEPATWFHGTVSSTTGTGDTAPVLAHTTGSGWTTDGGYLLNITKNQLNGILSGVSSAVSLTINSGATATFLNSLPITSITVTASAYSGATSYSTGQIVTSGGSNYVSIVNGNIGNTPVSSPSSWTVIPANQIPISTAIGIATSAITPAATTRDVPVAVSVTVNLAQIGGIYKLFTNGSVVSVAGISYPEQSIVSSASALLAGNQQTFTIHICNPNSQAIIFQGGIQGNYISADVNVMRSAYFAFGSLLGTDLIYGNQVTGGLSGNILPNAGCEAWQATGGNSAWHLYPGAEVVKNTDSGWACALEQNGVAWANTDVVECARFPTSGGATAFFTRTQYMPSNSGTGLSGIELLMNGPGTSGGNAHALRIINQQTPGTYTGAGGPLLAPWGITLTGVFGNSIYVATAPDNSFNAVLFVQSPNTHADDTTTIIELNWNAAGNLYFTTSTGRWAFSGAVDAQNGFLANHLPGLSVVETTAKLTPGGTNGSKTYTGGILTSFTAAT